MWVFWLAVALYIINCSNLVPLAYPLVCGVLIRYIRRTGPGLAHNSFTIKLNAMIPDKSVLLEQINTVIRNSYKDSPDFPEFSLPGSFSNSKFPTDLGAMRTSLLDQKNRESFIKLEERIEALEDQNNYLLYFIHFLYENFPDLVRNTAPLEKSPSLDGNGRRELPMDANYRSFREQQPALTKREMEVLELLVKGLCAKEIADNLFISETTVVTHKKNLKKKYNVRNTVELISKAFISRKAEII